LANVLFRIEGFEHARGHLRGMPGTVSPISIMTSPFSTRVVTYSVPEPRIASTASLIKFVHTWFGSPAYASIIGACRESRLILPPTAGALEEA
jgi:hypothetical protein